MYCNPILRRARRGQSSLEYMMTYGWAILAIIIIGYAVWQLGILSPGTATPGKRGFSQITPADWRLKLSNGNFTITMQNDAGSILQLMYANATLESAGTGDCTVPFNNGLPSIEFRPAALYTAYIGGCPVKGKPGEYYRLNVRIVYYKPASTLTHISTGVVWGPLE